MRRICFCFLLQLGLAASCLAQEIDPAQSTFALAPRFLAGVASDAEAIEPASVPALQRRVTLGAADATLGAALDAITRQTGIRFLLSSDVVSLDRPVRVEARGLSLAAALTELLLHANVDVAVVSPTEFALLRRRETQQPGTITGTVTVAETQGEAAQPLASAQVVVEGTGLGTLTDAEGRFRIAGVPVGRHTVAVSLIGYGRSTREVEVGDGATVTLDFALEVSPTALNELVVTVTGEQRRREVGNTVARIQADSLVRSAPVTSMSDLLQGRAPGVFSLPGSANVGRAGMLRIRGLNSVLVPNDPIVVVDGIRVEAGAGGRGSSLTPTRQTSGGYTGRLADLDPNEIASVEVVKGPSATTLYGTDAANGVLVITTKRGQAGPPRWTVFTEQGIVEQRLDEFPDAYYAFGHSTTTGEPQRCTLAQRAAGVCVADSLASFNAATHPETRPFKNGHRQQYGVQLSGGAAGGTTYFLSGDYQQETGTAHMPEVDQAFIRATQGREVPDWQVRPNAYKLLNLRANVTMPLGQRGSATVSTGFVSNQTRVVQDLTLAQTGYRDANDGWSIDLPNSRPAYQFATRYQDLVRRFLGSLATSYVVGDWLTLRGTVGADLSTNAFERLTRRGEFEPGHPWLNGNRDVYELGIARYSLDLAATATRAISTTIASRTSVGVQYNRRAQRGIQIVFVRDLPVGGETISGGSPLAGH